MRLQPFLAAACAGLAVALTLSGCNSDTKHDQQQEEVIRKSEELFRRYLEADISVARTSLLENADLLERATVLEPIGRSQLLAKTYFRLYVLEKRSGNEPVAEADLIKAKYWSLRNGEMMGVAVDKAMDQIKQYSPEHIFQYIDDFDRKNNKGKPPAFLETIRKPQDANRP
jgi:hypothetical protein